MKTPTTTTTLTTIFATIFLLLLIILPTYGQTLSTQHGMLVYPTPAQASDELQPWWYSTDQLNHSNIVPLQTAGETWNQRVSYAVVFTPAVPDDRECKTDNAGATPPVVAWGTPGCMGGLGSWTVDTYTTWTAAKVAYDALPSDAKSVAYLLSSVGQPVGSTPFLLVYPAGHRFYCY